MDKERRITNVYTFANGMCMVFDQYGQQMPEFQGRSEECLPKLMAAGFVGAVYAGKWPSANGQTGD